ncbi:M15 family metallopeptidase [Leptolyngbya sp. NIES-2104]|uniref:M15 family metallopeptidase n=1 Tax=Leptolyngbya sp. NIES-2104 TaxID=1552121 RepID=UPI0006EC6576|nr:M15 family metallopeptidase [Leptolyngbya sp. NIES-2104]GAP97505.1 D-alanyl-D-alanine carboxypeptidase [Leptolyngbya sp. NIES-2104]
MKVQISLAQLRNLGIAIATAAIVIAIGWVMQPEENAVTQVPSPVAASPAPTLTTPKPTIPAATVSPSVAPTDPIVKPTPVEKPAPVVKTLYGHLPYQEDDPARLITFGKYVRGSYERPESLDLEAAEAFKQMVALAQSQGVSLMPISGFRTIADQKILFARQIERRGSAEAAARLSAPPGHSEHHTGYAIDIADQQQPDTDLKYSFEQTKAYQWLNANAYQFGFEQSFPKNNWQGVSNEPWHWRYVVSPRAAQIFAIAKGGDRAN